jgi:HKD family nuclease
MQDTTENNQQLQDTIYANMDPAKRFKIATEFIDMGLKIRLHALKTEHPSATNEQMKLHLIKDLYGLDLFSYER